MNHSKHVETIKITQDGKNWNVFFLSLAHTRNHYYILNIFLVAFYINYKHAHIPTHNFSSTLTKDRKTTTMATATNHNNHLHTCFESMSQVVCIMLELNRAI